MKLTEYNQVWSIWQESNQKLYAYVLSRFKKKELAEEVTQEVLLKLHKACCSDKEIKNINSWLYQIAHNTALDITKKEAKKDMQLPLSTASEIDSKSYEEISKFLLPLIGFLPEKYGIPLKMSDIQGMRQKDIATELGLGISATKSRIQRARELLKTEISTCFHLQMDKNGTPIYASLKDCCEPLVEIKKNNL